MDALRLQFADGRLEQADLVSQVLLAIRRHPDIPVLLDSPVAMLIDGQKIRVPAGVGGVETDVEAAEIGDAPVLQRIAKRQVVLRGVARSVMAANGTFNSRVLHRQIAALGDHIGNAHRPQQIGGRLDFHPMLQEPVVVIDFHPDAQVHHRIVLCQGRRS